jgi:hypothetical protein
MGTVVVRRAGGYTFEQVHEAAFPGRTPEKRSLAGMKDGICDYMRQKYARD